MQISANSMQRALSAEFNMSEAAANYDRSTVGIVLDIIVGLLTFGIGVAVVELYHSYNRQHKKQDFENLMVDLLVAGLNFNNEEGISFVYKGLDMNIVACGDDICVKYDNQERTIKNKNIDDILDIVRIYFISENINSSENIEIIEIALLHESGNQRKIAVQYLKNNTNIKKFDHHDTRTLVQAAVDINNHIKTSEKVEEEFNAVKAGDDFLDAETVELIKKLNKQQADIFGKVDCLDVIKNSLTEINLLKPKNYEKIRNFFAEIVFPEKSWEVEIKSNEERLKDVLLTHSDFILEIIKNSEILDEGKMPKYFNDILKEIFNKISSGASSSFLDNSMVEEGIEKITDEEYDEYVDKINENLKNYDFELIFNNDILGFIAEGEGDIYDFLKSNLINYFAMQSIMDQRVMVSSFLRNFRPGSSMVSSDLFFRLVGPYMQGLIKHFEKNENYLLWSISSATLRKKITINEEIVQAYLEKIRGESNGEINEIKVVDILEVGSIGQTALIDIHWHGKNQPEQVVMKLLRPDVLLRAERELAFFEKEAIKIPGMLKIFNGIADKIKLEFDFSKEMENIKNSQVYGDGASNVQAMKLFERIPSSDKYILLEKAPGKTITDTLNEIEKTLIISEISDSSELIVAAQTVVKLGACIKSLIKKWTEELTLRSGFFHCELNAENIMFSTDAHEAGMIAVINTGKSEVISSEQRTAFIRIIAAIKTKDINIFFDEFKLIFPSENNKATEEKLKNFSEEIKIDIKRDINPMRFLQKVVYSAVRLGLKVDNTSINIINSYSSLENMLIKINEMSKIIDQKKLDFIQSQPGRFPKENDGSEALKWGRSQNIKRMVPDYSGVVCAVEEGVPSNDFSNIFPDKESQRLFYIWDVINEVISNNKARYLNMGFAIVVELKKKAIAKRFFG